MNADSVHLEALLAAAAASAEWPPTPDLRPAVRARLAATPDLRGPVLARIADAQRPSTHRPTARWRARLVLRAVAVALVAVVAVAGVVGALGYRLPGLDIELVPTLPPAGTALDLGSPVPLAEVVGSDRPRVLVPAALPTPGTAWELGAADRQIVSLAWRAEAGQPTLDDSDLALVLMAVPGRADDALIAKALPPGTVIEPVTVGGEPAWWISGRPHAIGFLRPDGEFGELPTRLAGDTLVFSRDGTVYRFESALGRDATIAIAESLR